MINYQRDERQIMSCKNNINTHKEDNSDKGMQEYLFYTVPGVRRSYQVVIVFGKISANHEHL